MIIQKPRASVRVSMADIEDDGQSFDLVYWTPPGVLYSLTSIRFL